MSEEENTSGTKPRTSDLVASHYNKIEEVGVEARKESRIYHLRNFNNWIKSVIIGEALDKIRGEKGFRYPIKVLDLGSGKGGDLRKYRIGRISHLVCADIAEVSVQHCNERYQEMLKPSKSQFNRQPPLYTAEFIVADCTRERVRDKIEDATIQFDLVSIQFAFHYCFESFHQAKCMLRNASENLRVGGFVVGTVPDAYRILQRLKKSDGSTFGNDVYSVTFPEDCKDSDEPMPLFGAKYIFHLEGVVDCPEFLVYFPVFEQLAKSYGLKLVYRKRFEDFFKDYADKQQHKTLLKKMNALETFTANSDSLVGKANDYSSAKEFLARKNPEDKVVGTLSQPEWEAATLYTAFVFVKVPL